MIVNYIVCLCYCQHLLGYLSHDMLGWSHCMCSCGITSDCNLFLFVLTSRWTQQLSPKLWFLFLFLYLCELLVLVIYLREWESNWKVSAV